MKLYQQWLESCKQCDIPAISTDTAARLMAILYEYGNNEDFTYNRKFLADKEYIQDRFGLQGACVPDPHFHALLRQYVKELQDYYIGHKSKDTMQDLEDLVPDWAPKLLKDRYNMKFIG